MGPQSRQLMRGNLDLEAPANLLTFGGDKFPLAAEGCRYLTVTVINFLFIILGRYTIYLSTNKKYMYCRYIM